jgi:hypothetical protein
MPRNSIFFLLDSYCIVISYNLNSCKLSLIDVYYGFLVGRIPHKLVFEIKKREVSYCFKVGHE